MGYKIARVDLHRAKGIGQREKETSNTEQRYKIFEVFSSSEISVR